MNFKKVIVRGSIVAFAAYTPVVFGIIFLFYTNRGIRLFVKNTIYDFYGYSEEEREPLITKSDEIWTRFWKGFWRGATHGKYSSLGSNSVEPQNETTRTPRVQKVNPKVGTHYGPSSPNSSTKFTHSVYKCFYCGSAGCTEAYCPDSNFDGTRCKMCSKSASFGR